MTAAERRNKLKEMLMSENQAVSASKLASRFSVSRQVIVGDIALLRTAGLEIDSTPRGYVIHKEQTGIIHQVACCHSGEEQMVDELNLMVDYGCKVIDVIVDHPIYGRLTGALYVESRYDVQLFANKVNECDALPLSSLTDGVHVHTLSCTSEEGYEQLVNELKKRGYLISEN